MLGMLFTQTSQRLTRKGRKKFWILASHPLKPVSWRLCGISIKIDFRFGFSV